MTNDFSLFAGDYRVLQVTVTDAEGAAVDLTGAEELRWQAGRAPGGGALVEKSLGQGVTVSDAAGGEFEVELNGSDTDAIAAGVYYHEAELIAAGGRPATILTGKLTLKATLIKPPAA